MHQPSRLEILFPSKALLIWRTVTIILLVASFLVPIFYEAPEADGLLSSGSTNLWTFLSTYGVVMVLGIPSLLSEALSQPQKFQALFYLLVTLFVVIGPISLLGYVGLNIVLYLKRWQQQFRLRFWLLGLACLWSSLFGWYNREDLLWGFIALIGGVVSAVLWEGVSYAIYRRRLN